MPVNPPIHICHLVDNYRPGELSQLLAHLVCNVDPVRYRHSIVSLSFDETRRASDDAKKPSGGVRTVDGRGRGLKQYGASNEKRGSRNQMLDENWAFAENVSFIALDNRPGLRWSTLVQLHRLFKSMQPDVCQSYSLTTLGCQWAARAAGVPLRIHHQHLQDLDDPLSYLRRYRYWGKFLAIATNKTVTTSASHHHCLQHDIGLKKDKTEVIRTGIDTRECRPPIRALKPEITNHFVDGAAVPAHKFVVGNIGEFTSSSNQKLLIDGFAAACKANTDFARHAVLILAGDGPELPSVQRHGQKTLSANQLIFATTLRQPQNLYYHFDLYANATCSHSLPIPLLEAMSMGVPFVAVPEGGVSDILDEEEPAAGLSANRKTPGHFAILMLSLFNDPPRRLRMGRAARQYIIDRFDPVLASQRYDAIYSEAIKLRKPTPPPKAVPAGHYDHTRFPERRRPQ